MTIDREEKERKKKEALREAFIINKFSKPLQVLRDVLCNGKDEMGDDTFYDYFYCSDDSIDEITTTFLKRLEKSECIFHAIHGYSQNGKSSLIGHLAREGRSDENFKVHTIVIDFKSIKLKKYNSKVAHILTNLFAIDSVDRYKSLIDEISGFNKFYNTILRNTNVKTLNSEYYDHFNTFMVDLREYLRKMTTDDPKATEADYNLVSSNFNKYIKEIVTQDNAGSYLSFVFLYSMFQNRNILLSIDPFYDKLVFVYDNIDDVMVDDDISFFSKPQIAVSDFLSTILNNPRVAMIVLRAMQIEWGSYIEEENIELPTLRGRLAVLHVFRTANMFVYGRLLQDQIKREGVPSTSTQYPTCLYTREYIKVRSVITTSDIIKRRITRFEEICDLFKEEYPQFSKKPDGYIILKLLSNIYNLRNEPRHGNDIYRIWNGDKREIFESINNNWDQMEKYIQNETIIRKVSRDRSKGMGYILKGMYIHMFIYLLNSDKGRYQGVSRTLLGYRTCKTESKNIYRIISNYIVNMNRKRMPDKMCDIVKEGAGLEKTISSIKEYIDYVNNKKANTYSYRQIIDYFAEVHDKAIDTYSQTVTIYKSQVRKKSEGKVLDKYYHINNEIEEILEGKSDPETENIKIYSNDNLYYMARYMITHYEHIAYEEDVRVPLICAMGVTENLLGDVRKYEFYEIVEKVFKATEISTKMKVKFYIDVLFDKYPPDKFVTSPLFSVLSKKDRIGTFQFRFQIATHVTYIEVFRNAFIKSDESEADKVMVNKYLTKVIIRYIDLYQEQFKKIMKHYNRKYINEDGYGLQKLKTTNGKFEKLKSIANGIYKNPKDLETPISTEDDKRN